MSSTLERPAVQLDATSQVPLTAGPAVHVTPEHAASPSGADAEREFAEFGRAIVIGVVLGIPLMMALVAGCVKLVDPDTEWVNVLAISTWVALFCGPFLAGTVTVGLWSSHQH